MGIEEPAEEETLKESVQKAAKEAAKAALETVRNAENLNRASAVVGKVTFALALGDRDTTVICSGLLLVASLAAAALLRVCLALCDLGVMRYVLWVIGVGALLPRRWRED